MVALSNNDTTVDGQKLLSFSWSVAALQQNHCLLLEFIFYKNGYLGELEKKC
jgi:hypothetical protein